MKQVAILAGLLAGGADPAMAGLEARFVEGAPKDSFVLTNVGSCPLAPAVATFDLSTAPSGLIFDVTGSGAGVEVFQPFELTEGAALVSDPPQVRDGDQSLSLSIAALAPGAAVSFTIDVDDTAGGREITISGSEIAGATLRVETETGTVEGLFDASAHASLTGSACQT